MLKKYITNFLMLCAISIVCIVIVEFLYRNTIEKNNYIYSKGMFIADKDLGYTLAPNFVGLAKKEEYANEIRTNNLGFRDVPRAVEKKERGVRILVIGDSFTNAYAVPFEAMYTRLLEEKLQLKSKKTIEVLNVGVPGYDTPQEIAYLARDGVKLNADIIVLAWYYNDFFGEPVGAAEYVVNGFLVTPQKEKTIRSFLFRHLRVVKYGYEIFSGKLNALRGKSPANDPNNFDIDSVRVAYASTATEQKMKRAFTQLQEFDAIAKSKNIPLVIMLIPADFHVVRSKQDVLLKQYTATRETIDFAKPYQTVAEFMRKELQISTLNLFDYFNDETNVVEYYLSLDGHFSEKGNEKVAEVLYNHLMKNFNFFSSVIPATCPPTCPSEVRRGLGPWHRREAGIQ